MGQVLAPEHWLLIISIFTNFDKEVEIHSSEFNGRQECEIAKSDYSKKVLPISDHGRLIIDCYFKGGKF